MLRSSNTEPCLFTQLYYCSQQKVVLPFLLVFLTFVISIGILIVFLKKLSI